MAEHDEPEKENEKMFKVEGSKRKIVKTKPGFDSEAINSREQTRAVSDKREDDAAMAYALKADDVCPSVLKRLER